MDPGPTAMREPAAEYGPLGTGHLGCVIAQQALVANTTGRGGHDAAFVPRSGAGIARFAARRTGVLWFKGDGFAARWTGAGH
ncbi:hypothetical protein ABGB14_13500 [Nonomuraea sp. B10E15]|uniref:hypothetical protein n=1 Tax=Nonomuraea sp. B10E15 TaxID=3153560 RepID=UPI00325CE4CC